jgi:hypothetical protein
MLHIALCHISNNITLHTQCHVTKPNVTHHHPMSQNVTQCVLQCLIYLRKRHTQSCGYIETFVWSDYTLEFDVTNHTMSHTWTMPHIKQCHITTHTMWHNKIRCHIPLSNVTKCHTMCFTMSHISKKKVYRVLQIYWDVRMIRLHFGIWFFSDQNYWKKWSDKSSITRHKETANPSVQTKILKKVFFNRSAPRKRSSLLCFLPSSRLFSQTGERESYQERT